MAGDGNLEGGNLIFVQIGVAGDFEGSELVFADEEVSKTGAGGRGECKVIVVRGKQAG